MKRMSDVFVLPVDHKKLEVYGAGEMDGVPYHVAEEHAAHAINHVDALADVIENVLHHHGDALSYEIKSWCVDALKAYRGEK